MVKEFIFEFGPTEYNILNNGPVNEELDDIIGNRTICFKAMSGDRLIGVATCNTHRIFLQYEQRDRKIGYLSQNVVHPEFRRKGIGSRLIEARKQFLLASGVTAIYVTHHADNSGSGGALQRNGFEILDTFSDPEKRLSGSRKTTVRRFEV